MNKKGNVVLDFTKEYTDLKQKFTEITKECKRFNKKSCSEDIQEALNVIEKFEQAIEKTIEDIDRYMKSEKNSIQQYEELFNACVKLENNIKAMEHYLNDINNRIYKISKEDKEKIDSLLKQKQNLPMDLVRELRIRSRINLLQMQRENEVGNNPDENKNRISKLKTSQPSNTRGKNLAELLELLERHVSNTKNAHSR